MNILFKAFGILQTNCYLISNEFNTIIVDPGEGATNWVLENIENNAIAIINTHGHYDHVYSNKELQEILDIPLFINEKDGYLLSQDIFSVGLPISNPNVFFLGDSQINIGNFVFNVIHLPGHSEGTTIYDFGKFILSGDFVMENTVGRYNLPTSDRQKQYLSLKKYFNYYSNRDDMGKVIVYSGHGNPFSLEQSLKTIEKWISFF